MSKTDIEKRLKAVEAKLKEILDRTEAENTAILHPAPRWWEVR